MSQGLFKLYPGEKPLLLSATLYCGITERRLVEIEVCIMTRVRINVPIKESDESTVDEVSWVLPLWTEIYRFA